MNTRPLLRWGPALVLAAAFGVLPRAALAQPQPPTPPQPTPLPAPAPAPAPAPVAQPVPPAAPPVVASPAPQPLPGPAPVPLPGPPPGMPPGWVPPPGAYPQPYAGGWAPYPVATGWGPSPVPPEPPPAEMPGVTAKGLPFSQRGGIFIEAAGMSTPTQNFEVPNGGSGGLVSNGVPIGAIDLFVRIPVLPQTFVDADVPVGLGALGNPMVGVHHVFRPVDPVWITLGGAFGFPLIHQQSFQQFAFANGLWDAERFMQDSVPFAVRFAVEGHVSFVELRAELAPVWGISFNSNLPHFFAWQHAAEIQLGHAIGGGLRYQGVTVGTNQFTSHYQPLVEAFFRLYHDPAFLRVGLLMPLADPLGTAFTETWGARATVGFDLD